ILAELRPGLSFFSLNYSGCRRQFFLIVFLVLTLGSRWCAFAQTNILTEGFEGAFPATWSTGDANTNGTPAYWKDEGPGFGTVAAHTGNWKGYCAGIGFGGTTANPVYQINMAAFMTHSVSLAGYTGANLGFWYNIPSIETSFDFL